MIPLAPCLLSTMTTPILLRTSSATMRATVSDALPAPKGTTSRTCLLGESPVLCAKAACPTRVAASSRPLTNFMYLSPESKCDARYDRLGSRHGSDVVGCAQPSERSARRIPCPYRAVLASHATLPHAWMARAARQMIGDATLGWRMNNSHDSIAFWNQ